MSYELPLEGHDLQKKLSEALKKDGCNGQTFENTPDSNSKCILVFHPSSKTLSQRI